MGPHSTRPHYERFIAISLIFYSNKKHAYSSHGLIFYIIQMVIIFTVDKPSKKLLSNLHMCRESATCNRLRKYPFQWSRDGDLKTSEHNVRTFRSFGQRIKALITVKFRVSLPYRPRRAARWRASWLRPWSFGVSLFSQVTSLLKVDSSRVIALKMNQYPGVSLLFSYFQFVGFRRVQRNTRRWDTFCRKASSGHHFRVRPKKSVCGPLGTV